MLSLYFQDSRARQFLDMSLTIQLSFLNLACLAPAWALHRETSDLA